MSLPFFKEERSAKLLLAGVIGLTLANSGVSVAFSYIGRDFWTALSQKDPEQFNIMLEASPPARFMGALVAGVPVTVFYRFQREKLALAWREWMTLRVMDIYYAGQTYYSLEAEREIDNPDQRIAEDVRAFTRVSLEFMITVITSVIDLASFSLILYRIYPQLFLAIIAYAGAGTAIAAALGRPLVGLNFEQLQKEADFRYSLIRVRENSESIAFYGGESVELAEIQRRLQLALDNFGDVIRAQRSLEFFTVSYRYLIQVLPGFVVAPLYFKGAIELGVVSQSYGAFNHILSDLSIVVNQFEALSQFSAGVERLSGFLARMSLEQDALAEAAAITSNGAAAAASANGATAASANGAAAAPGALNGDAAAVQAGAALSVRNVTVATPGGSRVLASGVSFDLPPGGRLLLVGQSGAGKSSLLRAVAGLWGAGCGAITRPPPEEIFFLPQRPYCTLGPLRDQITYPHRKEGEPSDAELLDLLRRVGLPDLASLSGDGDEHAGLWSVKDWSDMLSLGEQQRLAFARLLYNEPRLAVLDEATSALDLDSERRMFELLRELEGLAYVSVGHRPSLLKYHDTKLRLTPGGGTSNHSLEPITRGEVESSDAVAVL
ncbi:putative ABC transporter Nda [Tribonema minus]|uniref:Putative ABC transporter Nda n=1 Tax=Tribonema minus TaxID=303371 RepID=A0A835ZDB9_9STRA|nr:putative ABC transporter Nda [Tribonema minus]